MLEACTTRQKTQNSPSGKILEHGEPEGKEVATTQGAPTVSEQKRFSARTPPPQQASIPRKVPPPSLQVQPFPAQIPQLTGQQTLVF